MRSVYVKTLGCKVNTFDSHALENQFKAKGYALLDNPEAADITVINTCSVTAVAEKEARYLLRQYFRKNPDAVRVVTGCYAQINSATIADMQEVDFVVPNEAKDQLVALVEEQLNKPEGIKGLSRKLPEALQPVKDNQQGHFKAALTLFDSPRAEQARAFLKIQDGCNGFCAYCQIPWARGASRSVPPERVLEEAAHLLAQGVPEIVLTGIHIGDYGRDLNGQEDSALFFDLLRSLFKLPGLRRLRISSLEPSEVSPELVTILAENRDVFCEHFHLPLQSGSDRILHLMGRQYDRAGYTEALRLIRTHFPSAQISADVIPGFPSETDEEFQDCLQFIRDCDLASLHVFPYSQRPNTRALRMPGHLPPEVIKERASILRKLSEELYAGYARKFFGQSLPVLWENWEPNSRRVIGKTKNYLTVVSLPCDGPNDKPYSIEHVVLKGFSEAQKILGV